MSPIRYELVYATSVYAVKLDDAEDDMSELPTKHSEQLANQQCKEDTYEK
jgi:hypothetical protein